VMGCYATGVVAITAGSVAKPIGMACNSLTSVSLDPPLLLFCPARTSTTWPRIRAGGRFSVNVLARDQHGCCMRFARRGVNRFAGLSCHPRSCGVGIDGALAWIDCALEAEHDAGDHTIVVGRVLEFEVGLPSDPLVFHCGRYGTVRLDPGTPA
jgi:3-hydroxy-9,10-secoandrosta-1,3,5(10)-triene-9,17-dione monooxygenase reductase component